MIQRYDLFYPKDYVHGPLVRANDGRYVLYTDYLAKEDEIEALEHTTIQNGIIGVQKEQIAALEAALSEVTEKYNSAMELYDTEKTEHDRTKSDLTDLEAALREKDEQIKRSWGKFDDVMTALTEFQIASAEQIASLTAENKELRRRLHAHGDIQTDEEEKEAKEPR